MTAKEKQVQLAKYRIKQAKESIDEAICLLNGKSSSRSIINRAYYAMFYAILALMVFEPYSSSKHSGILSYFNKRFINGGVFPKELGRLVNKAFELRQEGDYREYAELTYELVKPFIERAQMFVMQVEDYLVNKVFHVEDEKP